MKSQPAIARIAMVPSFFTINGAVGQKACGLRGRDPPLNPIYKVTNPKDPRQSLLGRGGRRGNFPLASVGSQAGGDNRKRAHSPQRREGPKGNISLVRVTAP